MASSKDIYEGQIYASNIFAAGVFRGSGPADLPGVVEIRFTFESTDSSRLTLQSTDGTSRNIQSTDSTLLSQD